MFNKFWNIYDKKRGNKEKIYKLFCNLNNDEREEIFKILPAYIESTPIKKFRKDPHNYLNNKSWRDEIIMSSNMINKYKDIEPEKF